MITKAIEKTRKIWRQYRLESAYPELREIRKLEEQARRQHKPVRHLQARRRNILHNGLSH